MPDRAWPLARGLLELGVEDVAQLDAVIAFAAPVRLVRVFRVRAADARAKRYCQQDVEINAGVVGRERVDHLVGDHTCLAGLDRLPDSWTVEGQLRLAV